MAAFTRNKAALRRTQRSCGLFPETKIVAYGWIYATVSATEEATCAACKICVQLRPPIFGALSGTTMESPGLSTALSGSPDQRLELFFAERTEPSARITKVAFRSAMAVVPPAWLKYHFALLPGR
jgi:hypothetical protein